MLAREEGRVSMVELTRPEACSEREVMASGRPEVGIGLVVGQSIVEFGVMKIGRTCFVRDHYGTKETRELHILIVKYSR